MKESNLGLLLAEVPPSKLLQNLAPFSYAYALERKNLIQSDLGTSPWLFFKQISLVLQYAWC